MFSNRFFDWLNNLKPRGLLILSGVVFCLMFGLIYFFLSWQTTQEEQVEEVTPIVAMRTVITAKSDIPPLTVIKTEMLQSKEVPEALAPADAITDMSQILNATAKSEIFVGDVVTERKLLSDLKQLTFVGSIPPDCRAISISVNETTGVDGFIKPGDKVDLLLVETDEGRSATTSVLLQDVLLLSINKNMNKSSATTTAEDGTITTAAVENPSTATFALRPNEVLKLLSASKLGEIYLMLRPTNPTENYFNSIGYTINSINTPPPQVQVPMPVEVPATPAPLTPTPQPQKIETPSVDTNKIEIIQGDKIVQEK